MDSDLLGTLLPGGIALLVITFFLSRRRRRSAKRENTYAEWLSETREQIRKRQEGETAAFEDYTQRLRRQQELIDRYNREHERADS